MAENNKKIEEAQKKLVSNICVVHVHVPGIKQNNVSDGKK